MEEQGLGDTLIIQPASSLKPDYNKAIGIIIRSKGHNGSDWSFYNLLHVDNKILTCSGSHGSMKTAIDGAHYQLGDLLFTKEFVMVDSTGDNFPKSLRF